ncbi:hypothetical protein AMK16_26745 [Streptomyces sp. CB00455]|uniref:hypothetical protein n=1 Tax=Streptomyces sp. CB00455 TaxID=1703927 RepID=UPI00095DA0B5|nr:hypothetical protein [Streptomyces sp. CB00455]OKK16263.1 hypothetical protein AMK16_26745 [Streptomyces sp. CB00455]
MALVGRKAIAAHPNDVEAALTAYEVALFPRTEPFYAEAHDMLNLMIGDNAPSGFLDLFTAADQAE